MFRNPEDKPTATYTVNITVTGGGLGDLLAYLVAVNHIVVHCPWINPLVWVPDFLLDFAKNVLPTGTTVRNFTEAKHKYNPKNLGITTEWKNNNTPMRRHPVYYAYNVLADKQPTLEEASYLKVNINPGYTDIGHFNLPEKYVTVSIGSTNKAKELTVDILQDISEYVLSLGYTPVFLGKSNSVSGVETKGDIKAAISLVDTRIGIDLVDQTDLLETAAVIKGSAFLVGMEGGLVHLAGYTDAKVVAGYGFVNPQNIMPIREGKLGHNIFPVVPNESLGCRFCQSNLLLFYQHDFRTCWKHKDFECVKQLTFDKWKTKIDEALG